MAGSPEQSRRDEATQKTGVFEIVSSAKSYRITIPDRKIIVSVNVLDNNTIETSVSNIRKFTKRDRARAIADFTDKTRHLLYSRVRLLGTIVSGNFADSLESEALGSDLLVTRYEDEFRDTIELLKEMDFSGQTLEGLVKEVGMTITRGETHMGELPKPVREQVEDLSFKIRTVFEPETVE